MGAEFSSLSYLHTQLWPPSAGFTESECPDQTGKVFIVTGASAGVGKELARILYSKNAKVYLATRNEEKSLGAIAEIKSQLPTSKGELVFLKLVLDDLTTIKSSADEFLSKEDKLDVLWNNAGVMMPPNGTVTQQGYDLQLGTNLLGPFLFTKLLTPILIKTARASPPGSTRVVWVGSIATQLSPRGGVDLDNLDFHKQSIWHRQSLYKYAVSKSGQVLYGMHFARSYESDGIALNPGNLRSELLRHVNPLLAAIARFVALYPVVCGAYTELYAGLSPEISPENSVVPFGRLYPLRSDIVASGKPISEGGSGIAEKFWQWSEEQVKPYI